MRLRLKTKIKKRAWGDEATPHDRDGKQGGVQGKGGGGGGGVSTQRASKGVAPAYTC